jgi:uncharacterized protein (TIGR02145 family)
MKKLNICICLSFFWLFISCKKEKNNVIKLAPLSTLSVNSIQSSNASALSGGEITSDGGSNITSRGVVWSNAHNPTLANNVGSTYDGTGIGSFSSTMTKLKGSTTYYVRAWATNGAGTSYGNEVSFTTPSGFGIWFNQNITYGSVADQEGNTYATVVIGQQEWMAENLRSTKYANGDPIPNVTNNLTSGSGGWSNYNNIPYGPNAIDPIGKLYNWYTVNDSRNVCPSGWHVPSDAEWTVLINAGNSAINIKSSGAEFLYWPSNNITENQTGFSALPGGFRQGTGAFYGMGSSSFWWSSTQVTLNDAWGIYINDFSNDIQLYDEQKDYGYSVRCIKD